jgi:hypothetical protein
MALTLTSRGNPAGLILLACLATALAMTLTAWPPLTFLFVMLGWVLAVGVHEFGHAWVAWLGGDHTVEDKGYLTFDPRKYADLQTTLIWPLIALALGGIGFPGGAVWLREDLMRGPLWRSAASLAGPVGSFLVLVVLVLVLVLEGPRGGGVGRGQTRRAAVGGGGDHRMAIRVRRMPKSL